MSGGSLTGAGDLAVANGGSMTLSTGVGVSIDGVSVGTGATLTISGNMTLNGTQIDNFGTISWIGGDVRVRGGASVVNYASVAITSDQTIDDNGTPGASFTNFGTVVKGGTAGKTTLNVPFINDGGDTEVDSGTLEIGSGGSASSPFAVAAGATLEITGPLTLLTGANFNGVSPSSVGTVLVDTGFGSLDVGLNDSIVNNCTLELATGGGITGTLNPTTGVTTSSFTSNGDTTLNAITTIDNMQLVDFKGALHFSGTGANNISNSGVLIEADSDWRGANDIVMMDSSISNYGTFSIYNDRTIDQAVGSTTNSVWYNAASGAQRGVFVKVGGGAGPTNVYTYFYNNGGLLNLNGYEMDFYSSLVQTGTGAYTSFGGGKLVLQAPATTFYVQGGGVGGAGTISGNLAMQGGSINLNGAVSTLTVTGNYTATAGSSLIVLLSSLTSYSQLVVNGSASIDGALQLIVGSGYTPASGDTFTVVTGATSRTGSFATVTNPWSQTPTATGVKVSYP